MDTALLKESTRNEYDPQKDTHVEIERLHHDIQYIKWTTTCTLYMMIMYMITLMIEW